MGSTKDCATYRVFRIGGNPVFAVPTRSRGDRLAGIARYKPLTFKQSLYRSVMTLAIWSGFDRFISSTVFDPSFNNPGFDFGTWADALPSTLSVTRVSVAIMWPHEAHRSRLYVHVLDDRHRPIAFAKIALDERNDRRLDKEDQLLSQLSEEAYVGIHIPRVIDYRAARPGAHAVLLLESIPVDARLVEPSESSYPADFIKSFAGTPRSLGAEGCNALPWWPSYVDQRERINPAFSAELSRAQTEAALVCRSHGDLTIANLMRDSNDDVWVYDWEESCPDGPVLADEISFFLSVHRPRTAADYETLIAGFRDRFLAENDPCQRVDVMLALAFRSTVNAHKADVIISRWEQL